MKAFTLLLCLLQQGGPEILRDLKALLADPIANADELQRRHEGMEKILTQHAKFPGRRVLLSWYALVAQKTGHASESLEAFRELARTAEGAKDRNEMYLELLYASILSGNPKAMEEVGAEIRGKLTGGRAVEWLPYMEAGVSAAGKDARAIAAKTLDGKDFAWNARENKLLFITFTKST